MASHHGLAAPLIYTSAAMDVDRQRRRVESEPRHSHMLRSLSASAINLVNGVIDKFFDGDSDDIEEHLFIIDCLNHNLSTKYQIQKLVPDQKCEIMCNLLTSINGIHVTNLKELKSALELIKSNSFMIKIGLSYGNQNEIMI